MPSRAKISPLPKGLLFIVALCLCCADASSKELHHYVFLNNDRVRIADPAFLAAAALEGAQLKYTWRELEPEKDRYDFSAIHHDLDFLTAHGKKLFIQLQDSSFDESIVNVPRYLLGEAAFHGGADRHYDIPGDDEAHAKVAGWVARRWDPTVRERFQKLLTALGKEFDGKIEGINLPETALSYGASGRLYPKGFTPETYRDGIIANMEALKHAFPKTVVMQYANFMPGEWLPWNDKKYLRQVYERALELKVGVGGPDLLPYKRGQMSHSYPLIREADGKVPSGAAVQWGNYQFVNPKTGKAVTISELQEFATSYLGVDYIFWSVQEPFFSKNVLPFLAAQIEKQHAQENAPAERDEVLVKRPMAI